MSELFKFYKGRIESCPSYGFTSGQEILDVIHSCAYYSANHGELTVSEFRSIINLCVEMHKKLLEDNYNAGWQDE